MYRANLHAMVEEARRPWKMGLGLVLGKDVVLEKGSFPPPGGEGGNLWERGLSYPVEEGLGVQRTAI